MKNNYSYPIEYSLYTTDEIIQLVQFFESIEKHYQKKISDQQLLNHYQQFQKLVPGKADRNNMYKAFYKESGYDTYQLIYKLTKNS